MRDLRVTLVQSMLQWEDAAANRARFAARLEHLAGATDLIVLPEMFTTGFSMHAAALAEPPEGPTLAWMRAQAARCDAALYGSIIVEEQGKRYNRGLFVRPDGSVSHYDKRHLFRMAGEHGPYTAGRERVVAHWRGWRILLLVCYDLRFPVFSRSRGDYDLVLYVANWPEPRRMAWRQLLVARAIENQACVVGVNRVGMDGKGIHYSGDSLAVDATGHVLADPEPSREAVVTVAFDGAALVAYREKFPVALDADDFELKL
jgi:predicted amidohydrolase